jgi:radical SAM superfamily enzyme YgiQ (UPF0313 family)
MARIAIVKVRSGHDIEWTLPRAADLALRVPGFRTLRRHLKATEGRPFMPQLTLPYLAALGQRYNEAHDRDHRFVLIDERADRIRLEGFDMVWFTAVSPTIREVYHLSDAARARGTLTVIGGIHATMLPEEVAAHADAVAIGEGEATVDEILADLDAGQGLRPRYRGRPVEALERLPLPRWRDAEVADYCPWVVPVQTSRGCRNACRFCSTTRYQGGHRRHRPVQEIVDEIRALKDRGILTPEKVVFFTDNNIVSDSDHRRGVTDTSYARSLFAALEPEQILWVGQGEINVAADRELTELMARSGCFSLLVGFETIDQQNLGAVGKPSNDVETYLERIQTLHDHDVSLIGCFIFGLDHDGPEVFERTRPFIEENIDVPQISLLTPFPGTALHRQMKREGRLLHEDWSQYDITHVVFRPRGMTPEQADAGYLSLTQHVYSYPAILARALRHASRRRRYANPRLTFSSRFSSVLAPNLIYRCLPRVGRGRAQVQPEAAQQAELQLLQQVAQPVGFR